MQVHWARHNLNELSQLLQTLPPPHKLHPLLRRAHGSVSAAEGAFSIPAACACAMRMRHVLQVPTHIEKSKLPLHVVLLKRNSADLSGLCVGFDRLGSLRGCCTV